MPIYVKKLINSPLEEKKTEIELDGDKIDKISVRFPPGCCGLLHVRIYYGDEKVIPKNKEESIVGDNETIVWIEDWRFPQKPCPVVIYTYNEDDTYDHQCFLRIVTTREELKKPKIRFRKLMR